MDGLLELIGLRLAEAYAMYGIAFVLIPALSFAYVVLLCAVVWAVAAHARERRPWPWLPARIRRWGRLAIEIAFGLLNPLLYLGILAASFPALRGEAALWPLAALTAIAWLLLVGFWTIRMFGAAVDGRSRVAHAVVRTVLFAALACLAMFALKDTRLLGEVTAEERVTAIGLLSIAVRVAPFYLIPIVLLYDYLRKTSAHDRDLRDSGLFLLRSRSARVVAGGLIAVGLVTLAVGMHRSSETIVRMMVRDHRDAIVAAATRHHVDPKLIAAIVYVTHRDQLSPFRAALERLVTSAWTRGYWPEMGANETLLNRPLDISVGLAQIKPRTAQTATLLATGQRPESLGDAAVAYRDGEPAGEAWAVLPASTASQPLPIPVPASRQAIARALLDARSNLETCALILSLYQRQWEAASPEWTLRGRPEILATLYQIGFARSKPHAAPRSNAFGDRVRQVHDQRWLAELFGSTGRPPAREDEGHAVD